MFIFRFCISIFKICYDRVMCEIIIGCFLKLMNLVNFFKNLYYLCVFYLEWKVVLRKLKWVLKSRIIGEWNWDCGGL